MAATDLPQHLIDSGQELLAALDGTGLQAQGAAWIFSHELGDWRFVVATSLVDSVGRLWVYKQLSRVIAKLEMPEHLTIADVHLIGTRNPMFETLSRLFHVQGGMVRFTNCAINEQLFDAAIYRWSSQPLSAPDLKKLERNFARRIRELAG
jgi:hypothetical protein